jgi:uncharacterized protein (DUF1501 family)
LASNGGSAFTSISAGGNAVLMTGNDVLQYQVNKDGPTPVYALSNEFGYSGAMKGSTLRGLITRPSNNLMEKEFAIVTKRAIDLQAQVANGIGGLAGQMKIVARLIGARNTFGVKRQVFFVQLGGFDQHDKLITDHAQRLGLVNEAMSQFQTALAELGVENKVTTFTASDFGRTLSSNGDGSDHGWGGHHFVMGGAVQGGRYYGTAPKISITSDDQVGQGRLLPSSSVDQYAATLARWFGVSPTEMPAIFPNLANFATPNLGFLG